MAENWWENDPVAGKQVAPAGTVPPDVSATDWTSADPIAGTQAPERGFWGALNQRAGSLASGINREGLAVSFGAPADFSNYLANLGIRGVNAVTGSEYAPLTRPPLGSERIGDFFAGTVGETKPEDLTDKILYGTGGAIGQTVVGMGAGAGLNAISRAPRVAEALIGGPQLTPRTAALNTGIGAASGAGSELGGEAADWATGGDPTARAIGSVGGGLVTGLTAGLTPAAARGGAALTRPFTQSGREDLAGQELLKQSGGYVPDLPPDSPLGVNLSLAQRTNNPGLLQYERALESNAPPNVRGQFEADRTRNNQIVRGAMEQIGAVGDPAAHSEYLAGALDTASEQSRKGVADAYAAIPGATVPTQPLKDNFTNYVSGLTKVRRQFVPDNYEQILMGLDEHEPMREVMDLRSSLLADERSARRAGDYNRGNVLRELDKALFQHIPEGGAPAITTGDQAATLAYQRANQLNVEHNATFNAGPMRKVFEGRGFDATVPDSQVAQTLLGSGPGQIERVAQFVKAASLQPEAMQNARDWFSSQLANKVSGARQDAMGDPEVLGNVMRKFVRDNQALIDSPIFNQQQRQLIGHILEAVQASERTGRAGARGGSDTTILGAGGRYLDRVIGGWFAPIAERAAGGIGAVAGGAIGGTPGAVVGYGAGESAARAITQNARVGDQLRELLYRATRDPRLGIDLMKRASNRANDAFVGPALRQILARSIVPPAVDTNYGGRPPGGGSGGGTPPPEDLGAGSMEGEQSRPFAASAPEAIARFLLSGGDPEAQASARASTAMQPAVLDYLQRALSDASEGLGRSTYDPSRSFAQNALDPRGIEQATNIALGVGPGAIRAFHGSPHDFNRFDVNKIGTGEGAQAYGHGLYFAGAEPTAETYVGPQARWQYGRTNAQTIYDKVNSPALERGLDNEGWSKLNAQRGFWEKVVLGRSPRSIIDDAAANPDQYGSHELAYIQSLDPDKFVRRGGHMYEVDINAEPHQFLDWDKPIPQQSPQAQDALRKAGWAIDRMTSHTGGDLVRQYEQAAAPSYASQKLSEAGIPGIRYLDQGSRGAGEGTSNYVVFDPNLIEILRKYGLAAGGALGAGALYGSDSAQAAKPQQAKAKPPRK